MITLKSDVYEVKHKEDNWPLFWYKIGFRRNFHWAPLIKENTSFLHYWEVSKNCMTKENRPQYNTILPGSTRASFITETFIQVRIDLVDHRVVSPALGVLGQSERPSPWPTTSRCSTAVPRHINHKEVPTNISTPISVAARDHPLAAVMANNTFWQLITLEVLASF